MAKVAEAKINLLINKLPWIATYSSFSLDYKKSPFEGDYLDKIKNNIFLGLCISKHPSKLDDFAWQNIRGDPYLQNWIFSENSRLKKEHEEIWEFYQGWYITDVIKGDEEVNYLWEKSDRNRKIFQNANFIKKNLTTEIKQKCLEYFKAEQRILRPSTVVSFGGHSWDVLKEVLNIREPQVKFLELSHRNLEYFIYENSTFYHVRHYQQGWIRQLYNDLIGIYNKNNE